MTVRPNHETQKLEVTSRPTKCRHYHLYYNDGEFGWMFFKIQTWFPYNAQIYINGREYLSRLLDKNGIHYQMYNNSFSYIENFERAQEIADGILNKKLSDSFDSIAKKSITCCRMLKRYSMQVATGALTNVSLQLIILSKNVKI